MKVGAPGLQDGCLPAEEADPDRREDAHNQPHRLRKPSADHCAGQRDTLCTADVAGPNAGADHSKDGAAQAEQDRDEKVVQSRADPVAGERCGAKATHRRRDKDDGQVELNGAQRRDGTDPQDIVKKTPSQDTQP